MSKNISIIVNILIFIIPFLYDLFFLKKMRYCWFVIIGILLLFLIDNYFNTIKGGAFGGLFYGLMIVFFVYFVSFICLLKIIYFSVKKILKNEKSRNG